jgi:hypothetical protein
MVARGEGEKNRRKGERKTELIREGKGILGMAVMAEARTFMTLLPQPMADGRVERVKGDNVHEANRSPLKTPGAYRLMTYAALHYSLVLYILRYTLTTDTLRPTLTAIVFVSCTVSVLHRPIRLPDTAPRRRRSPAKYPVAGRASTSPERAR